MSDGSFDLSSASAAALAHLQGSPADATSSSSSLPASAPAPSTDGQAPGAPSGEHTSTGAVTTPESAASQTPASKTYKVKVDGVEVDVPEQELLNGYSRTAVWTKRQQQLAEERRAFEATQTEAQARAEAQAAREAQFNDFMRNPQNVARYYAFLTGQQLAAQQAQQPQAQDIAQADQLATLSQAHQLAQRQAQDLQRQLERQIAETKRWTEETIGRTQAEAKQRENALAYQGQINTTIDALVSEHPILRGVEDISDLLQKDAEKLAPNTIGEALEALKSVAQVRAEKLNATFTEMQKRAAVERTKLSTNGIEPPGGAAPSPPPVKAKLGDKSLTANAIAYMESLQSARK